MSLTPSRPRPRLEPVRRVARGLTFHLILAALVVLYGGLLRFDALSLTYGPVVGPEWLRALQASRPTVSRLRPEALRWAPTPLFPHRDGSATRYVSDPYTYLEYARAMHSFYAAHRREPLFPFATKVALALLHDDDEAVSVASAVFSTLTIAATVALGWYVWSFGVGLLAGLGVAIDRDLITAGVGGWRDDAFTFAVVMFALTAIRFVRRPSVASAVLLGAAAGIACLVRITSLSFVLPVCAWLAIVADAPWRVRLRRATLAALVCAVLLAPFMINCWRVFGDPLYAINVHAGVYRAVEAPDPRDTETAAQYLRGQISSRPIRTFQTAVLGLTVYPFANKWSGLDYLSPRLGRFASWAAILGLALMACSRVGRLLLIVLVTSLVPFAFTWRLLRDWRFTEHAYPFFMLAAAFAVMAGVHVARKRDLKLIRPDDPGSAWRALAAALALSLAGVVLVAIVLPPLAALETLRGGESYSVETGHDDWFFIGDGWSSTTTTGSIATRLMLGADATIRLLLPRPGKYVMMLRLDPFPPPADGGADLPSVWVLVNGRPVSRLQLRWDPSRVGTYQVTLAPEATRAGVNYLKLVLDRAEGPRVRFWYLRVQPGG